MDLKLLLIKVLFGNYGCLAGIFLTIQSKYISAEISKDIELYSYIIHPYSHLLYNGSAHFSCLIHGENVLKDISSSMKISLLWRFGLYVLGLHFPIFPSQLISAFQWYTVNFCTPYNCYFIAYNLFIILCWGPKY